MVNSLLIMTMKGSGPARRNPHLIAGMLSTFPAIVINSLLFPLLLIYIGIYSMDSGSFGEFLILTISAPVGEELCKAAFVLSLYKLIDSPKRGFQIGFSGFQMSRSPDLLICRFQTSEDDLLRVKTDLVYKT